MQWCRNKYLAREITMGNIQSSSERTRTESITFRLPKKILEQLELEARQNNTSENVLVKQILTNYMDWVKLGSGIGILLLTKESFGVLGKNLDLHDIEVIIQNIHSQIKNFGIVKYGHYGPTEALESLTLYMRMSNFAFVHLKDQNEHRFLINHKLGIMWSVILQELFKKIFSEFVREDQFKFKTGDDSLVASVMLDSDSATIP